MGWRGAWTNENTFATEFDDIGFGESYVLQTRFIQDNLEMTVKERSHDALLTLSGKMNPE